jgi:enterochelin esterase family protein
MPAALTWLWRNHSAEKTSEAYEMDPTEKDKPLFRVKIYNR